VKLLVGSWTAILLLIVLITGVACNPSDTEKKKQPGDGNQAQATDASKGKLNAFDGPPIPGTTVYIILVDNGDGTCSQMGSNGMNGALAIIPTGYSIAWIAPTAPKAANHTITVGFDPPPAATVGTPYTTTPFYSSSFTSDTGNVSASAPNFMSGVTTFYTTVNIGDTKCTNVGGKAGNLGIIMK